MNAGPTLHPSSYRDPSGFIFTKDGIVYRQVNTCYKKDFEHFTGSGYYQHLVDKNLLIPHEEVLQNLSGSDNWFKTLKPEQLAYISYPYEWSFDMLKDAALLTLSLAKEALNFGMTLKDATPFNVQLHQGKMIFIDTLSFAVLDETKPWIAYRQFCETFLAPLALMHYLQQPLQSMMQAYPEGIPLALSSKMLPWKSKFNIGCYLHIHLNAQYSNKKANAARKQVSFSKQKLSNILESLLQTIKGFKLEHKAVWSGYYDEAKQREHYIDSKKNIIQNWIKKLQVKSAIDAGANDGFFSELLAEKGINIISTDFDHYSVNRLYYKIKTQKIENITPIILDLSNPSPALGVNNKERASFIQRTQTDLVMALAVIHHLCIGKNIPFESIAAFFNVIGKELIIEFVPKQDIKVQEMLKQKEDIYTWYNKENFLKAFSKCYTVLVQQEIGTSGRTLFLMRRNEVE